MPVLDLAEGSIDPNELSMEALKQEINQRARPAKLLRRMMTTLEAKRAAKGLGWSRPWNKYGVSTFRTHIMNFETDGAFIAQVRWLLALRLGEGHCRQFIDPLLNATGRRAFVFYQMFSPNDAEGLTLSFGRAAPNDRRRRDRLDLVFRDAVQDGDVDGVVDTLDIYECPTPVFNNPRHVEVHDELNEPAFRHAVQVVYGRAVELYDRWKGDQARQWGHWGTRYIEYFGPRTFIPRSTRFK